MKPLAVGYLRLHTSDQPGRGAELTEQIRAYAEQEGLTLSDVYTDLIDPPADHPERAGFCALMDALRREGCRAVIIPGAEHLSRRFSSYSARRSIIEVEGPPGFSWSTGDVGVRPTDSRVTSVHPALQSAR